MTKSVLIPTLAVAFRRCVLTMVLTLAPCLAYGQLLGNASFDVPAVTANTDSLRPTGATWAFTGQAGIRNNSAPNGSDGKQAAFLSAAPSGGNNNFGSVRQSISLKPGTYFVRYLAAVKTPAGRPQPLQFYVNGAAVGSVLNPRYLTDTATGGFEAGWTQPFIVSTAGTYELRFDATNATNYGTAGAPLYATAYIDNIIVASVPGALANGGLEAAGSWTLSSGATVVAATDAPEGGKVLTLAASATAAQTISLPEGRYSLSMKIGKASVASGTLNVEIASNGGAVATVASMAATTATEYRTFTTPGFALPSGNHVVTLRATGSSFSLDNLVLNDAAPDAANAGFETPVLASPSSATAAGTVSANPTGASWTFSGTGGQIQTNAGSSNTTAPRTIAGKQYLGLSGTGAIAQSLNFAGGTYVAIAQVAQGGVNVRIDGTNVARLSSSTLDFREVMSAPFAVTAGSHSLSFAVDTTFSPAAPKVDEVRLLRVDTLPAVSITSPANGTVFQTGATVNITATASDVDGLGTLVIARTPAGGAASQLASGTVSPLSTSWSNASANTYTLTATATDSTGATNAASITIRVNANPNTIASMSPSGPVVTSATAVSTTLSVTSATDSDGSVTKVEFLLDGALVTSCSKTIPPATAPYTCAVSLAPRAAAYALTARVTDNDGGVTTTSPFSLRVNTAPTVSLAAACVAPCTAAAAVNLTATPSDSDGSIAKVEFYDGATLLGSKTAAPWTFAASGVASGSHSYTAKAFDNDSATVTSSVQTITVGAAVPTLALTASCTAPCNAPASVALTATASNITGTISKVEFYDGATLLNSDTTSPYAFTATSVAAATHPYSAKVYVTGNTVAVATSATQNVRVNALPTVTLAASCVAPCANPATVNLTATPADADGTIAKVEFYDGATLLGSKTAAPWTFAHSAAAAGSHSYTAKAFDNDNASTTSTAQAATVAAGLPAVALVANCIAPCSGLSTVTLSATPANISGTIARVEFYDAGSLVGTDTTSPYGITLNSVGAATHSYTASVYVSGNATAVATSTAQSVRVNARPSVSIAAACIAPCAPPATVTLTAVPVDGDGTISKVEFYQGAALLGTLTAGPWTWTVNGLAEGAYTFDAIAYDNNGASQSASLSSGTAAVTVETPAPNVAAGRPARQSSTLGASAAGLAVDADNVSASSTTLENYPWWEIDLGRAYLVTSIVVTPKAGTEPALADLWVLTSAVPFAPLDGTQLAQQQQYGDLSVNSEASASAVTGATSGATVITPTSGGAARYVRLWSRVPGTTLSLSDVRILGRIPAVGPTVRAEGATLVGASDGALADASSPISLSVQVLPDTAANTAGAISKVELYDGATLLATTVSPPFGFSLTPGASDRRLQARVANGDGTSVWSNEIRLRGQASGDSALRILSPQPQAIAWSGALGIPKYFTLRGTWAPEAGATLEYLLECLNGCSNTWAWQPIRQVDGSAYVALVNWPNIDFPASAPNARVTVRATSTNGAQRFVSSDFIVRTVAVNLVAPSFVDAADQSLTGQIVGAGTRSAQATLRYFLEQVYWRDGVVREIPYDGCSKTTAYWTFGTCSTSAFSVVRQFYRSFSTSSVATGLDGSFSVAANGLASVASDGETGPEINTANTPWSTGPKGWFRVYAGGQVRVPGYLPFAPSRTAYSYLRYGTLAPVIETNNVPPTLWQGGTLQLYAHFYDYDDSRVPLPSDVTWQENGVTVAQASSCNVFGGPASPMEHKFTCWAEWVNPPLGTHPLTLRIADRQGQTTTTAAQTVTVQPWAVAIVSPADNAAFASGTMVTIQASFPATTYADSNLALLEDGVQVATRTSRSGAASFAFVPAAGTHVYRVRATNPDGGVAVSSDLTLRVLNAQAPVVSLVSPTATGDYSQQAPISIQVNATSASSTISTVILRSNGSEIARLTAAPYSYNWSNVAAGTYALQAEAVDALGLSSRSSTVNITVYASAPVAPTVTLSSPAGISGFSVNDQSNGWACLQLSASSSDSTIRSTKVLINGVADINLQDDPYSPSANSNRNVCLTGLSAGAYNLKARAESSRGAIADSAVLTVTIAASSAAFVQPSTVDYYQTGGPPALIQGQATMLALSAAGITGTAVRADFYDNDNDLMSGRPPVASGAAPGLTASWTPGSTGLRRLIGCVTNDSGVRSCTSAGSFVAIVAPANAITVALSGPATAAAGATLSYSATLTVGGNVNVQKVGLFDADTGELLAERSVAPYAFDLTVPLSRRLVAVAYSSRGDQFASAPLVVTSSNQAPTIAISQPVTGAEFPANSSVAITVTGSDADGSVAQVQLWRQGDNSSADTLLGSANAATLSYTFTVPAGTQTIRFYAYVIDNNGAKIKSAVTAITGRSDISDPRYFVWTNFNAALKAGNKAEAMKLLTPTAQDIYGAAIDLIMPNASSIVASYSTLLAVATLPDRADYLVGRLVDGQRFIFAIRFIRWEDGTWKLESM